MDWGGFKDLDPNQFVDMDEEEKLNLAQSLGYSGTTQEDMDRYQIGDYDTTGEERLFEDAAYGIGKVGEGAQSSLLRAGQAQDTLRSQQGFENTGNPMIDKQREDIFAGITDATNRGWTTTTRNLHDMRQGAMQKFGDRVMSFENKVDAEAAANAPKEKGFFTKLWDNTFGVGGLGKIFSDERLKENIQFQHVDSIGMPVYTYNYTYDKGTPQVGYMAQDVEKIYPDAISETQGFKQVDYSKIIKRAKSIGGK
jgi:hypothetical protein